MRSLWSECYGQTLLVYTKMEARSRCNEGGEAEGGRSRTRADPDQMEVRAGHGWREEGGDRSVLEALIRPE